MSEAVAVSVVCSTYNHANYIEDAIKGFLMQKTSFPFEVLIRDDASTDGTSQIVAKYADLYPDLIVPFIYKENQYSQGKLREAFNYVISKARGKYIAICEGDDYWTDPLKLQKQYDVLEAHPETDMCSHAFSVLNCVQNIMYECYLDTKEFVIPVKRLIPESGGYLATNSLFLRKSVFELNYEFRKMISIDYTLQILGALRGGIYYIPDNMSVYRYLVPNSWSLRQMKTSVEYSIKEASRWRLMLEKLNEETNGEYRLEVGKKILTGCISSYDTYKNKRAVLKKYKESLALLSFKKRLKIILYVYCGFLAGLIKKIKVKLKLLKHGKE